MRGRRGTRRGRCRLRGHLLAWCGQIRSKGKKRGGDVPEADFHEEEDVDTASDEEKLHEEIVEGDPVVEQVEVARDEDDDIERLRFEGDAWVGEGRALNACVIGARRKVRIGEERDL